MRKKMILVKFRNTQIIKRLFTIAIAIFLSFAFATAIQAATFTVTKTADTNDGTCDADCSLREAIAAANTAATDDIIEFASPLFDTAQTITLSGNQFSIASGSGALTINGTGAKLLTIDGNNQNRIFLNNGDMTIINDLRITNGRRPDGSDALGGGIRNEGLLTINRVVVDNNRAVGGGGISAGTTSGASLTVNSSTISNNTTSGSIGGGIFCGTQTILIVNSTISGNSAAAGGGIDSGGTPGDVTIINTTIANNSATFRGGGIQSQSKIKIKNTIVADNMAPEAPDVLSGITSEGYNLIENVLGVTILGDTTGNILGQDPQLFSLADNGGPTPTHAPSINSPVIDKGSAAVVPFAPIARNNSKYFDSKSKSNLADLMMPITTDQRGMMRPQDVSFIANAPGGDGSDIGAFEAIAPTSAGVEISGRVITNGKGRGIGNVTIQMSDSSGNLQTVRTNQFGRFRFTNVNAGETYVFNVYSKGYQFSPQVIFVSEQLDELTFTPN